MSAAARRRARLHRIRHAGAIALERDAYSDSLPFCSTPPRRRSSSASLSASWVRTTRSAVCACSSHEHVALALIRSICSKLSFICIHLTISSTSSPFTRPWHMEYRSSYHIKCLHASHRSGSAGEGKQGGEITMNAQQWAVHGQPRDQVVVSALRRVDGFMQGGRCDEHCLLGVARMHSKPGRAQVWMGRLCYRRP